MALRRKEDGLNGLVMTGTLHGAWEGAKQGALLGGVAGLAYGALSGWKNPFLCFTAGTQVVVSLEVREPDGRVRQVTAAELAGDGGRVPAAMLSRVVGYVTAAIETLQKDAWIVSRDDQEPFGSLVFRRVEEVFRNTAYRLLHLTLRSSGGVEQTLLTTAEHPAYVLGQGWVAAGKLKAGDTISEPGGGFSSVVACRSQEYPEGIEVFNLRVQESHTYFVRAEGSTAEPVWVHNSYDSNNLKGGTYENVRASAVAREGEMPFFRAGKTTTRRGGFDMVTLAEDGMVTIEESKFQNRLQFDDFTAITENLRGNVQEVLDSIGGMNTISRANKMTIRSALGNFLDGQVPSNLRIRVASGKAVIGPRLQSRIGANTGGIPVVFQ